MAQLGPAVLRVGGTAADYSWYLPDDPRTGDGDAHTVISNRVFDAVVSFAQRANVQLMWDFNGLQRDANGDWDPRCGCRGA